MGSTALSLAAWKGHVEVVQLLLQERVDVNNCTAVSTIIIHIVCTVRIKMTF